MYAILTEFYARIKILFVTEFCQYTQFQIKFRSTKFVSLHIFNYNLTTFIQHICVFQPHIHSVQYLCYNNNCMFIFFLEHAVVFVCRGWKV